MKRWADRGGAFAELVLEGTAGYVRAQRMLDDPDVVGNLDAEQLFDLYKAAGYSQASCEAAARDWGIKRLRAGMSA